MTFPQARELLGAALADRYRIEHELGSGGMATVYLAADLKHDRKVAMKVLKPELAAVLGAERFVQEIKTTAALSHPHILPLFDSGEAGGFLYYVMPFIEGETIREKLNRETHFGIDEAVRIATEVADALDYAHRHGVIHRDIKPENILLHDGRPMVMDFGIALAVSAAAGGRMTETGLSLGTPYYMSPEQATADKEITARSDVYSLASVLFEMLAGVPPHEGGSAQQVIMRIIADTPRPVTDLRMTVPPNIAAALAKALEKLPADRFESAKLFAEALGNPAFRHGGDAVAAGGTNGDGAGVRRWRRISIGAGGVALIALAGLLVLLTRHVPEAPVVYFDVTLPPEVSLVVQQGVNFDVSRDGSTVVFLGQDSVGRQLLWLRRSDRLDPERLAGTEAARNPRFSPDGQSVAFIVGDSLKTVSITGTPPLTVVPDSVAGGGGGGGLAWGVDGYLYFRGARGDIWRIPATGGATERLLPGDSAANYAWFDALPNGRGLILTITTGLDPTESRVAVLYLKTRELKDLVQGTMGRFASPGELLYATAQGQVLSVAFNADNLEIGDAPHPVMDGIQVNSGSATYFAVSESGALLYATGSSSVGSVLAWVSSDGSIDIVPMSRASRGMPTSPAISPDGKRIAFQSFLGTSGPDYGGDIWIYDVAQRTLAPLMTSDRSSQPVWSPDGRQVSYRVYRSGPERFSFETRRADFSGSARELLPPTAGATAALWTPDGSALVYSDTLRRILYAPLGSGSPPTPVTDRVLPAAAGPAVASMQFSLSPDGRWVAFTGSISGSTEVYVAPLPGPGGRVPVSTGGGFNPRWTRDGSAIVYRAPGNVWAIAAVRTAPNFAVVSRRKFADALTFFGGYDVAPDGRILATLRGTAGQSDTNRIRLITDWRRGLAARQ
jgi:serine/threonine-protein kinase